MKAGEYHLVTRATINQPEYLKISFFIVQNLVTSYPSVAIFLHWSHTTTFSPYNIPTLWLMTRCSIPYMLTNSSQCTSIVITIMEDPYNRYPIMARLRYCNWEKKITFLCYHYTDLTFFYLTDWRYCTQKKKITKKSEVLRKKKEIHQQKVGGMEKERGPTRKVDR